MFDPAKGQLHATTGTIVVDEHLPTLQLARHSQLAAAITGPDACHQSIGRAVSHRQRLGFAFKRDHRLHGAEDFVLCDGVLG